MLSTYFREIRQSGDQLCATDTVIYYEAKDSANVT